MTDPQFPIVTLTNKLAYDVDIYDVFAEKEGPGVPLTYKKLVTLESGATAQAVQTERKISELQAMRTGKIEALNGNYYHQFPVAKMVIDPFDKYSFILNSPAEEGTKNELDPAAMERSFKFIKYISANPNTKLATDFLAAVVNKTDEDPIDTFFAGTASFKLCTKATWNAVANWQSQFTSAWQGTFYLYSKGAPAAEGTKTSPPALIATLVVNSSAEDDSATFAMTSAGDQQVKITMVGDGTMQNANPGDDSLTVSLRPNWVNVLQTSTIDDKPTTQYVMGVVFTGTINDINVVGMSGKLPRPNPNASESDSWQAIKDKVSNFSIDTIFKIAGLLVSVGMLVVMVKAHQNSTTKKGDEAVEKASDKADAKKRREKAESSERDRDAPAEEIEMQDLNLNAPKVAEGYVTMAQAKELSNKLDVVQEQIVKLREVVETAPPNPRVEKAVDKVLDAQENIDQAADSNKSVQERQAKLDDSSDNLDEVKTEISNELDDANSNLSNEAQTQIEGARQAIVQEQAEVKANNEAKEDLEKEAEKDPSETVDEGRLDDETSPDNTEFDPLTGSEL